MPRSTSHSPPDSPLRGRGRNNGTWNKKSAPQPPPNYSATILAIFDEAQNSKSAHRKLFNSLRKLHLESITNHFIADYFRSLVEALNVVLGSKIKRPVIERLLSFLSGFISFSLAKDRETAARSAGASKNSDISSAEVDGNGSTDFIEEDNFPSTQLATMLINYLLKGIDVKDKNVRYRCARLIYLISSSLPYIDEELYGSLKRVLSSRTRDKEPQVRREIVLALSTLQAGEDDQDGILVTQKLAEMTMQDPAPFVRRIALSHITLTPGNLAAVISRCRDVDPATRQSIYKLLNMQVPDCAVLGPNHLNTLLSSGLSDPDITVRQACIGLVHTWVKGSPMVLTKILALLNVVNCPISESLVIECLRGTKKSGPLRLKMNPNAWRNLTPETALILRCYTVVYLENPDLVSETTGCSTAHVDLNEPDSADLDTSFTTVDEVLVVERLAYFLQLHCNQMITNRDEALEPAYLYVVSELVKLALLADYSEPHGCGLMFTLARNMLRSQAVHEDLVGPLTQLLRMLSVDERDYIRIVHEIILDTMDMPSADELMDQAGNSGISVDQLLEEEMLFRHLKCLIILRRSLEATPMSWNSDAMVPLHGLVNELVAPASSRFPDIGEVVSNALACLGLISLTSEEHAKCHALQLVEFANLPSAQRLADDEIMQVYLVALASLLDLVLLYGVDALGLDECTVVDTFLGAIDDPLLPISATAIPGCVKLCLSGRITNLRLVGALFEHALSGKWAANPEIQQCLEFYMDNYATTDANKRSVSEAFPSILSTLHREFGFRNATLVTAGTKLAVCLEDNELGAELQLDAMLQLLDGTNADTIPFKPAVQLCSKWMVRGGSVDAAKVRRVQAILTNVPTGMGDPPTHNAMAKLEGTLIAVYPVHPELNRIQNELDGSPGLTHSQNDDDVGDVSLERNESEVDGILARQKNDIDVEGGTPEISSTVRDAGRRVPDLFNGGAAIKSKARPNHTIEIEVPQLSRRVPMPVTPRARVMTRSRNRISTGSDDDEKMEEYGAKPTPAKRSMLRRNNLIPTRNTDRTKENPRKRRAPVSEQQENDHQLASMHLTGSDQLALQQLGPEQAQRALALAHDLDAILSSDDE